MDKQKSVIVLPNYAPFLEQIKSRIQESRIKASLCVNKKLIKLYWSIGKDIAEKQKQEAWGAKVIDRLSHDLSNTFPGISGFSTRNLKYMRKFASTYQDSLFVQQVAAQIQWWHHVVLNEIISITGFDPERTVKFLNDKEFEIFWKAIERIEKWEVGREDFIEKWYISGVHKKNGVITEYLVQYETKKLWFSKDECIKLAMQNRLHATLVHMKNGNTFLRPEYNQKHFELII